MMHDMINVSITLERWQWLAIVLPVILVIGAGFVASLLEIRDKVCS